MKVQNQRNGANVMTHEELIAAVHILADIMKQHHVELNLDITEWNKLDEVYWDTLERTD